jgi:negative regulator of flagellin synthesis FlgM
MPDPIQGVTTNIPLGVTSTGQSGATPSTDGNAASQIVAPATDNADVGQTEALLVQIMQAANNAPSVDEARVNALQQAVQNGTYQVDSMAIAKKLMGLDTNSGGDGE